MPTPLEYQLRLASATASALTKLTDINIQRCNELIAGADPTIDEVRKIAKALGLPARDLITYSPSDSRVIGRLRENYRTKDESRSRETLGLLQQAQELASILSIRRSQKIRVDISESNRDINLAEDLARFARARILREDDRNPITNLERSITVNTNLTIVILNLKVIEGCTISLDRHDFIFLAERGDPRMRFTLAHELCHYLVDSGEEGGWFDEDPMFVGIQHRSAERFANAFAGALLLPAEATARALAVFRRRQKVSSDNISDVEIVFLARFFGVNFQAAGRRCEDLQLIPRGASHSLYESIVKRYRSPEKFADDLNLPPRQPDDWGFGSDVAIHETSSAVRSGEVSIGRLSEALRMSPIDVAAKL